MIYTVKAFTKSQNIPESESVINTVKKKIYILLYLWVQKLVWEII